MCTQISIKTLQNDIITGRTNEFGQYYRNNVSFFPRNYDVPNFAIGKSTKLRKAKYAVIGCNIGELFGEAASGLEFLSDGFNEEGLSVGVLYYPNMATYEVVTKASEEMIDVLATPYLILSHCKTVAEAREYVEAHQGKFVVLAGADQPGHFLFIDRTGDAAVFEPDQKGRIEIKPSNGIMTNSPQYEWHLKNLGVYSNIQQFDTADSVLRNLDGSSAHSHGTCGAFGLPGDTSPTSRFVKANYLANASTKSNVVTAEDGVLRLLRIFNNFDIIPGMALKRIPTTADGETAASGEVPTTMVDNAVETDFENTVAAHTDHTIVKDLTNLKFYYKDWTNQSIRYVAFEDYDLDSSEVVTVKMVEDNALKAQRIVMK
ncbi:TPA: linear amide C-N hydrolase [Photobacterium damselae]|uniref:linear amide C-N hydrolase n=1 Tax=Photobacterium damselae TaxID=38293 RepID=UPI001F1CDC8F|nr:linear amide C-N hydrolase [Photobacterium damselae]MCG9778377.1 linear amide C-N hydrolase [Photobacterium damselae]UJZ95071.1 linear amide C-N hydrolase [Photobacterium damselae subsp. damselae]UJZ99052.1 linear amide C-N hydrolase [Photobacterium damselae subsp. damselae]